MASFTSTVTSNTWQRRMCACGYGHCIVKISRPTKNPSPTLHVPALCPVSVGLVGAKNQGDTARTMPHPEMTLSCKCGMMSYSFNSHCFSLKPLSMCYALLLSFCCYVCMETNLRFQYVDCYDYKFGLCSFTSLTY
ncbi:hypothetical protein CsSME_00037761 [Camellia sinensis var. sinensis]